MGGAYFCGACGKKLSTSLYSTNRASTQPSPPLPPLPLSLEEERKEEGGNEDGELAATPVKGGKEGEEGGKGAGAGGMSGLFARLTSGKAKRGAGEENKENAAPAGTPVAASVTQPNSNSGNTSSLGASSSMQTPMKSPLTSASNPLSPSSSSSTALPSPLSAPSPTPFNPMSPIAGNTTPARASVLATPQRYAPPIPSRTNPATPSASTSASSATAGAMSPSSQQSAVAASIRAEVEAEYSRDMALLNVECEQLHQRLMALTDERNALQSMLDQSMNEYSAVVDDSINKRNDYVAHVGILEAELNQLRQQRDHESTQLDHFHAQLTDTKQQLDDRSQQVALLTDQLTAATAEADEWKAKYEQLRETATAKLKQSGNEYLAIRQREQEKDIALQGLQRELHVLTERERTLAQRCKDSDERIDRERSDRQLVEDELQACRSDLVNFTRELAEVKRQAEEWRARMEENGAIAMRYKEQVLEQRERMRREEKERRDGGGGGGGGGGGAEEQRLRLELMRVRGDLERKEGENRELMEMVEGLLAQVEQQKADAHDHNETY